MEENDQGNKRPRNPQIPHRVTNFFIDNILRPDFGRKKDGGETRGSESSLNLHSPAQTEPVGGNTVPAEGNLHSSHCHRDQEAPYSRGGVPESLQRERRPVPKLRLRQFPSQLEPSPVQ
ncbi:hypothetical protein KUCAC02_017694 [Chaenocephalus aceratus]|uniref:Uncharacterized protein n=1 Tax=Chaenocephalus aceratus TaxID=36190 RepID=A0ACB9W1Z9_CHAAC|nr:hypothetical protein KUCAC02_017694 [Chaenocephalus aceratus]